MPTRKSEEIPVALIEAYQTEKNKAELGRLLGIPRTTINSILNKKFEVHGSVENRHRSGRKPKFTVRDEVQLARVMKNNRRGTLNDITNEINEGKDSTFCLFVLRLSGENYFKWVTTDGNKKRRWSSENVIEKNEFHGVGREKTGQLMITGKTGYLVTNVR